MSGRIMHCTRVPDLHCSSIAYTIIYTHFIYCTNANLKRSMLTKIYTYIYSHIWRRGCFRNVFVTSPHFMCKATCSKLSIASKETECIDLN